MVVSPNGKTVFVTGEKDGDAYGATVAYNTATGAQLWVKLFKGPGGGSCISDNAVAVSPDGKTVFVTGECGTALVVSEYATVAYNAATGARLWAKRYGGPVGSSDMADSVAVSPNGKTVFISGVSASSTFTDDATVAYSAATGAQLWAKRHSGGLVNIAQTYSNSLAVSPNGKMVFVAGIQGAAGDIGAGYDTIAYNAATGAQLWTKRYTSDGGADSVAVSPNGSTVFVTGEAYGSTTGLEYATVAYNAATGAQRWAKSYRGDSGPSGTQAYSVAVSPSGGTVYVAGYSWQPAFDRTTIAYNATTGAQQWIKFYLVPSNGGSEVVAGPVVVAVSPISGTVIVTGTTASGEWATVAYKG